MHAVWVAHRHCSVGRVRVADGRRVRDHALDLVSEVRQACEHPLFGFPYRSAGWQHLSAALEAANLTVSELDADPYLSGKIIALALLSPGLLYAGPIQELDGEMEFWVNFSG